MKDAVLLLMHQGKSFTAEAARACAAHGLDLVALSSWPEKQETLVSTRQHLADCIVTSGPRLGPDDVEGIAGIYAARGYALRASVATFEGYRLLMAGLNRQLGAPDAAIAPLQRCLNKFELRQFLFREGLSAVRSHLVRPGERPSVEPARWFVKPIRGAGSFATFILEDLDALDDLPGIQEQMKNDHRMAAIFMDQYDFLVEEYIEGPEFSFETIVVDDAFHICAQEKARLERLPRTTLEAMSISPPISIDRDLVLAGADFISRCLARIGLTGGAFHIEAKYWTSRQRWEIVEINPRMGGSLINASVEAITGSSILELWIDSLLACTAEERGRLRERLARVSQLESLRLGTASKATVFLSKYGAKGRTIDSIRFDPEERKPDILKLHVEPGTKLDESDRAICLMDALWQVDYAELPNEVGLLERHAAEHFHVEYR